MSFALASLSSSVNCGADCLSFSSEDRSATALAPLINQLRDFGVSGNDAELELLLVNARLDVPRALNMYLDCGSVTLANALNDPAVDDEAAAATTSMNALTSRDRRRVKRHGGTMMVERDSCEAFARAPRSVRNMPVRAAGREKKSSDCRVFQTGQEKLGDKFAVHYAAHGIGFEVDVHAMLQRDSTTGQTTKVRRSKPGQWSVKKSSQKSNGWTMYPDELTAELERVYVGMLEGTYGTRGITQRKRTESFEDNAAPDAGPSDSFATRSTRQLTLLELLEHERGMGLREMEGDEVAAALKIALSEASNGPKMAVAAANLIMALAQRQGLQCTPTEARQAGLVIGSMAVLRAVIMSDPSMQLSGVEIFDRKFPGLKINERGRKDGIRSLLARGMTLGQHAPTSKLLRKIEDDSAPLFASRFFAAMLRTYDFMPEQVVIRVSMFLSERYVLGQ